MKVNHSDPRKINENRPHLSDPSLVLTTATWRVFCQTCIIILGQGYGSLVKIEKYNTNCWTAPHNCIYIRLIHLLIWQVKLRSHWLKMTCINKLHSGPQLDHNVMALRDSICNMDMLRVDIGTVFRHVRTQTLTITRWHFIPVHPLRCFQLYYIITFFSTKVFVYFAADILRTKQSR